jgi:phosphoglycerol transferase MdoB-like AlkP superfamily enzyme
MKGDNMLTSSKSKITLWIIEAIIAVNVLYLSGYPLIKNVSDGFNGNGVSEGLETFLTGSGPYTASFWLRLVSLVAALGILFCFPREKAPKKYLKYRVRADFTLAVLFFYIVCLSIIFGTFSDYLWVQPVVYSMIMGVAYVSNSWWYNDGS